MAGNEVDPKLSICRVANPFARGKLHAHLESGCKWDDNRIKKIEASHCLEILLILLTYASINQKLGGKNFLRVKETSRKRAALLIY